MIGLDLSYSNCELTIILSLALLNDFNGFFSETPSRGPQHKDACQYKKRIENRAIQTSTKLKASIVHQVDSPVANHSIISK